ncbi:LacI family DNA-binding transcriptional regulator [Oceanispirochaeta sp.]|jgi:LacI family transcriptional regulator|uniref:LacI family DNA-binding transcriptional regulator n=1 Tax=Oceanispirochaeta sp. TaxID=2035350 RepID=UPI00261BEFB0|nr:LacI family DNA-binding transcriptional regulator [Oceanispirochaeta sp.]MDA3958260.1 LacI family DNA-binding transcriptional regulator [Oceanispirochaeta sp.]
MPTIKDIAEAVGVSIGTVDRIIHKRGRFSEKTAEKVRQVMEELQYTPNIHARGLKKTKSHSFAALIPHLTQDIGYWHLVAEGIQKAAAELESYGCRVSLFTFDRYSSESCCSVLQKALDSGIEGLLIAPVRPDAIKNFLKDLTIPYLFIDSNIPELPGHLSYIGQDSFQSGILSGKLMSLLLGPAEGADAEVSVLLIDPPGSNPHLKKRMNGFRQYMLENRKDILLIDMKEEEDDEGSFHRYLEEFFSSSDVLPRGVFVANSSVYYVASYLEKKGETYCRIPLIGYDLIPGREEFIEKGIIDFILTQQPEDQGYKGVIQLYDSQVLQKDIQREVLTPLNIITRENLHTFEHYAKKIKGV